MDGSEIINRFDLIFVILILCDKSFYLLRSILRIYNTRNRKITCLVLRNLNVMWPDITEIAGRIIGHFIVTNC